MSILIAPAVLVGVTLALGTGLVWLRSRLPNKENALIDAIDALLPQTQCAQCGYPGCRPYAEAVATGAPLDLCPPGGTETVAALRNLLGEDAGEAAAKPQPPAAGPPFPENVLAPADLPSPLSATGATAYDSTGDADIGATEQLAGNRSGRYPQPSAINASASFAVVAKVREPECVGCALCIKACPVDAIIGAPGFMHTVLERHCTGCELCLPACPVDCIDLMPAPSLAAPAQPWAVRKGRRTTLDRLGGQPMRRLATGPGSHPGAPQAVSRDAPCIGCNRCEEACPEGLAPQHLLRLLRAGQSAQAAAAGLGKCIECRLCDRACPTDIPLAGLFHRAKSELAQRAAKDTNAAAAKARFQARKARLAQKASAAEARRAERLARLLNHPSATTADKGTKQAVKTTLQTEARAT